MPPLKVNPKGSRVIDKLGPRQRLRCLAPLHPGHDGGKHVGLGLKRDPLGRCTAALPKRPCARAAVAVKHAGYAEEAEVVVQLLVRARHVVPEARRVEAGDLVVLPAVVGDDLAAACFEWRESLRVGSDVEWVEVVGASCQGRVVVDGVPRRVIENDVPEPVLRTRCQRWKGTRRRQGKPTCE